MKRSLFLFFLTVLSVIAKSQDSTHLNSTQTSSKKDWTKLDLSTRANDHFMIQYGYDAWPNVPDSINTSGFSRHFNAYVMLDKPFRTNPNFSVGFGLGIGTSNIFFSNTYVDLKANTQTLQFTPVGNTDHFDKYKLVTGFVEIPIELRYVTNPVQPDKGLKAALGAKGGFLLSAHTKGKNLMDSTGRSIYDTKYIAKESEKKFFNTTRLAVTGRVGYGHISVDGSYQVTNLLKTGAGPTIHPWSIGLTLSGL